MTVLQEFKESISFYQCLHVLLYLNSRFCVHNSFNILIVSWKSFIFLKIDAVKCDKCSEIQIDQCFSFDIFELFWRSRHDNSCCKCQWQWLKCSVDADFKRFKATKTYCQIWKQCLKSSKTNVWHRKKRVLRCFINVKKAAVLTVWDSFYFKNKHKYFNCSIESSCYWSAWCFDDLINDLNQVVQFHCISHFWKKTWNCWWSVLTIKTNF